MSIQPQQRPPYRPSCSQKHQAIVKGYQRQSGGAPLAGKGKEMGNGKGKGQGVLADPVLLCPSDTASPWEWSCFFIMFAASAGPKGLDFPRLGPWD